LTSTDRFYLLVPNQQKLSFRDTMLTFFCR
jgi:hypothetical protein